MPDYEKIDEMVEKLKHSFKDPLEEYEKILRMIEPLDFFEQEEVLHHISVIIMRYFDCNPKR